MTKQEEIKEQAINTIQYGAELNRQEASRLADSILMFQNLIGVVIKVERDSFYCHIPMDKVELSGKTAYVETSEIKKAGYEAVESLIKEA